MAIIPLPDVIPLPQPTELGTGNSVVLPASSNLQQWGVVAVDANGRAFSPDRTVQSDVESIIGVASFAALVGEDVLIRTAGAICTGAPTWPRGPLWLGTSGELTPVVPVYPAIRIQIATALTDSSIAVQPMQAILLCA